MPRQDLRAATLAWPPRAPPGLMLVRLADEQARRKAQRLGFRLFHDPVDFLACLVKQDRKAALKKGRVVLAATTDTGTDFDIAAQIVAVFIGAFYTTPREFAQQESPRGVQYAEKLRSSATTYHVAVTAALQADRPTLPHLLRALAQAPGGCVKLYLKPKKLTKFIEAQGKGAPRLLKRACVLCRPGEEKDVKTSRKQLYNSVKNWVLQFHASVSSACPGVTSVRGC